MLQMSLGLEDLTLLNAMSASGSTCRRDVQYAAHAIDAGQASVVVCVYADAPLRRAARRRQRPYSGREVAAERHGRPALRLRRRTAGNPATRSPRGGTCTCTARRSEQLGAIAVGAARSGRR